MRILVAEDDATLSQQIKAALSEEGRAVDIAANGEEALFLGSTEPYDLVVLDIGLPERDGITVLKKWRKENVATPVLILTARDGWSERVDGLDAGADDYMTKPFHMPELSARIRAMIRRQSGNANPVFQKGPIVFDSRTNKVLNNGMPVSLTAQELAVLAYMFHNAGRMISRTELSEHIYEYDGDRDSNTIAVFVNRLRKKLGKELITSARGQGYQLSLD
ncbi:MAG: response regulator transcription factor [Paracoccaceae bacterium]